MSRVHSARRAQGGAALIVVLVLLLIVTMLGLASLRGTLLEERMSANLFDRSLAFQAVEAALREAELSVANPNAASTFPTSGCSAQLCARQVVAAGTVPRWDDASFTGWKNATTFSSGSIQMNAQYFIEYMGLAPSWAGCDQLKPSNPQCLKPRFRITARTSDAGRSHVMLQTSYVSP